MLKYISFGSGSSGNCYYIFTEKGGIFIDVGIGARALRQFFDRYGLKLTDVKAILVTHDHADHVKSVGSVSADLGIPVYTTHRVHHGIDNNYVVRHKIDVASRRYVVVGETFTVLDMEITPVSVPHDSRDNVGYRIKHEGVIFVLMTDCGCVTDSMGAFISEANYLILESNHHVEKLLNGRYPQFLKDRILSERGHLSNESCGSALVKYATPELKKVWLCHLSSDNNDPELARKTVEGILRDSGIITGKDFDLEILKRTTPSGIYDLV